VLPCSRSDAPQAADMKNSPNEIFFVWCVVEQDRARQVWRDDVAQRAAALLRCRALAPTLLKRPTRNSRVNFFLFWRVVEQARARQERSWSDDVTQHAAALLRCRALAPTLLKRPTRNSRGEFFFVLACCGAGQSTTREVMERRCNSACCSTAALSCSRSDAPQAADKKLPSEFFFVWRVVEQDRARQVWRDDVAQRAAALPCCRALAPTLLKWST
jgi:hypothetical protein